jgi:hypothetical protein
MITTYTKISKPTTTYTKVSGGHYLYDDVVDTYDTSSTTYDGLNHMSQYTNVDKPVTYLLQENGSYLLQEDNSKILLTGTDYTNVTKAT